ncbi:hypothetical protein PR003_g20163 [Phytophthora rubi]|uniref:Uncharacterized protein n=1 Tax=Phytophthora rubi TaxID=129364 RepID=A0A6A3ILT6_9STRA|nr:hypothetical protein PR001_g24024 [Phytophthora rubi]KAE8981495.1 hypothetical protein PR002_g23813 [Phytophthora rubi]KAE9310863.1 hypothetical protein PR003_g20163 [Phytophthora rubi]
MVAARGTADYGKVAARGTANPVTKISNSLQMHLHHCPTRSANLPTPDEEDIDEGSPTAQGASNFFYPSCEDISGAAPLAILGSDYENDEGTG